MKLKRMFTSIFVLILIFLCLTTNSVEASFFDNDDDKESEIEKTIDADERWIV